MVTRLVGGCLCGNDERECGGGRLGKARRAQGRQRESGHTDGGRAERNRTESSPSAVGDGYDPAGALLAHPLGGGFRMFDCLIAQTEVIRGKKEA
jgi:hypothetical protein